MNTFLKSTITVLMVLVAFTSCAQTKKSQQKRHSASTENVTKLSPVDKNGYFNVLNAPQTNSTFSTQSEENSDGSLTTKIFKGNKLLQTFKHEASTSQVHFIDINFDGYEDLLIGPATARNYSIFYLFDKKKGSFVTTMQDACLNGYFLVNYNKKHFVKMSSNGASSTFYETFSWEGNKFVVNETLMVFSDPSEYADNDVTTKYTLIKGDDYYGPGSVGCVKMRTNNLRDLPKQWQKIIDSFENME